jgi:ATP-dependent DNA ligase
MSLDFVPFTNLMRDLRATNSLKEKEALLTRALINPHSGGPVLDLLRAAYNPYRPYYLTPKTFKDVIDGGSPQSAEHDADGLFEEFADIAAALTTRDLSGGAAHRAVRDYLGRCSPRTGAEVRRVLCKDLQAGVSVSTINKAVRAAGKSDELRIPTFELMKGMDPSYVDQLVLPAQVDYKYDGERLVLVAHDARNGNYTPYSSEGRVSDANVDVWSDHVAKIARFYDQDSLVLDCEIIAESFAAVAKGKGKGADRSSRRLVLFDVMTGDEWRDRSCAAKLGDRTGAIDELMAAVGDELPGMQRSVYRVCATMDEVQEFFREAVDAGLEGVMAKSCGSPYEWKRSRHWVKLKPVNTAEGRVVRIKPGKPGSKWEHGVGSIDVEGEVEDGTPFEVSVPSMSDKMRADILARPDAYLGHTIELWYDCLSLAEGATVHSLRFPRPHRMRPDKD